MTSTLHPTPFVPAASDPQDTADAQLVERVAAGDAQAYRLLSDRYLPRVFSFCSRLTRQTSEAEELTQETFLRLWQKADSYRPGQAKLISWLFRIARNLYIDSQRRRREHPSEETDREASSERPSTLLQRKQTAERVQSALDTLPERQRSALLLAHYEELPAAEAADILGLGLRAYESLLARARRALRKQLTSPTSAALEAIQ